MEWAKNVQINIELLNHDLNIWDRKLEAAIVNQGKSLSNSFPLGSKLQIVKQHDQCS